MEQAYNELYSEFVRLRSICIRQAALLQKLSRELHKPHGSNESFGGVASMPVQCSQEHTQDRIPPLIATNKDASANSGMVPHHRPVTEKLSLNVPRRRDTNKEEEQSPQPASPAVRSPADSGAGSYEATPREKRIEPYGMAWGYSPLLDGEGLHPSGGPFMSEMELQSQMCEFCHAIFPGQTATRGEFLRHLHTHIT
ncbi:hypothetical protein N1851_015559 [Merluccius polli]|uniref:TRAF family member-associated NF-kappa-B activator n=1 Tax=Merluccius polli TaxID=89951 RepID=A0AA47MSP2_MERPO|nr:hypothetical protein N1851_015559 [Merluccius polli]